MFDKIKNFVGGVAMLGAALWEFVILGNKPFGPPPEDNIPPPTPDATADPASKD